MYIRRTSDSGTSVPWVLTITSACPKKDHRRPESTSAKMVYSVSRVKRQGSAVSTARVSASGRPVPVTSERSNAATCAYDAALRAFPALTSTLAGVRAEHAEHLLALTGPPPTGAPLTQSPSSAPADTAPPATRAQALTQLADAERLAAQGHADDSLEASRTLAYLLAALAASEHSHPAVLA